MSVVDRRAVGGVESRGRILFYSGDDITFTILYARRRQRRCATVRLNDVTRRINIAACNECSFDRRGPHSAANTTILFNTAVPGTAPGMGLLDIIEFRHRPRVSKLVRT